MFHRKRILYLLINLSWCYLNTQQRYEIFIDLNAQRNIELRTIISFNYMCLKLLRFYKVLIFTTYINRRIAKNETTIKFWLQKDLYAYITVVVNIRKC